MENYVNVQDTSTGWVNPSSSSSKVNEIKNETNMNYQKIDESLTTNFASLNDKLNNIINQIQELNSRLSNLSTTNVSNVKVAEEPIITQTNIENDNPFESAFDFIEPVNNVDEITEEIPKQEKLSFLNENTLPNNEVLEEPSITSLQDFMTSAKTAQETDTPATIEISQDVSEINDISNSFPVEIEAKMNGKGARFVSINDNSKILINK